LKFTSRNLLLPTQKKLIMKMSSGLCQKPFVVVILILVKLKFVMESSIFSQLPKKKFWQIIKNSRARTAAALLKHWVGVSG
jgi:hypothetical protein